MTVRYVCDDPDRLAARLFSRVAAGVDCKCCVFWRGALTGAVLFCLIDVAIWCAIRFT